MTHATTMTDPAIVLLTSPAPHIVDCIGALRPGLRLLPLSPAIPREPLGPTVWAFVDWLLPDLSGLELCRRLREAEHTRHAHVTMVLEGGDAETRRRALAAGADDYLVGPLTAEALLDRLDGLHPDRPRAPAGPQLRHGDLAVDLAAFQARYLGRALPLRPTELRLLAHFIEHPDQVFSRRSLIGRLNKEAGEIDERTVDVWIGRLRRALRAHGVPDPLRTVRSMGYVLDSLPG